MHWGVGGFYSSAPHTTQHPALLQSAEFKHGWRDDSYLDQFEEICTIVENIKGLKSSELKNSEVLKNLQTFFGKEPKILKDEKKYWLAILKKKDEKEKEKMTKKMKKVIEILQVKNKMNDKNTWWPTKQINIWILAFNQACRQILNEAK